MSIPAIQQSEPIIYIYTHIYPCFLDFLPIKFTTEHWVEFPVLYSRSLLVVDFAHSISNVYTSTPVSQFIPYLPVVCIPDDAEISFWFTQASLNVCGARSLREIEAYCVGSAEAACLAIFSSFLMFRSLKGCVTVIPVVRQVEWHLLTLRSLGTSCVTM